MTLASDDATRGAIRERLKANLYVEAGAGTGKTTSLVDRVVNVITQGRATIEQIVAITFTRAAASELRSRIRERLEAMAVGGEMGDDSRGRVERALEGIDSAAFQTIDSFALSLLRERPLQAGLPPLLTPRDELEAEIQFADEWSRWLDAELSSDNPKFREALGRATRLGLSDPINSLREVAESFNGSYDMLVNETFDPPTSTRQDAFTSLAAEFVRIESLMRYCSDSTDRLFVHLDSTVRAWVRRFSQVDPGDYEADYLLGECPKLTPGRGSGRKGSWASSASGSDPRDEILESLKSMQEIVDSERQVAALGALGDLLRAVKQMAVDYAVRRRQTGTLEFHDMLALARDMLATDAESRAFFQRRYPVVLVDEFQDTDAIQVELLDLLTRPDRGESTGTLFLVGDPKQSIYRFRRADVAVSESVRTDALNRGDWLPLRENHRSQRPIVDWVNQVFGGWMERQRREYGDFQTSYIPLVHSSSPGKGAVPPGSTNSAVHRFGGASDQKAWLTRQAESQDIARIASVAGGGGFTVRDERSGEFRASSFADVCVLLRTRTGIDQLEQAFSDAGVPFSLEGQSLIFSTQEFRDLENALAAVDDPTDQVSVVAALRSPVFGCTDQEIWLWADSGGVFDYSRSLPPDAKSRSPGIAAAFDRLAGLHSLRMSAPFPVVVETLIRGRRLREAAHLGPERVERLRRIDLLAAQANELRDAGLTSLRDFIAWLEQRREGKARAPEAVMARTSANAVRVMTVHAAKGLEFPIVILGGNASTGARSAKRVIITPRTSRGSRVHVRLGRQELGFETPGYSAAANNEKIAEEAERARLMYVAATRARDHLFVSLHRKAVKTDRTPAAEFEAACEGIGGIWREYSPPDVAVPATSMSRPIAVDLSEESRRRWIAWRDSAFAAATHRGYVTATELIPDWPADLLPKEPSPDVVDEPWRRGRAAQGFGRAVHAVLQLAEPDGRDIDVLAVEQALAHDLGRERAHAIATHVRKTMACPAVVASRGRPTWRELWFAAPLSPGGDKAPTLEGAIDLIYEDDDGRLVIVDYKTDRVSGGTLEEKAKPYAQQLGAYAWAVEQLTHKTVSRAVLVFSSEAVEDRLAEYEIPDLDAAKSGAHAAANQFVRQSPD